MRKWLAYLSGGLLGLIVATALDVAAQQIILSDGTIADKVVIYNSSGGEATLGGSGGTSAVDDAAFAAAVDQGTPMMGFFSADTVNAGDVGVLAMDASRRLLVSIEADNVGIGGGVQYTEAAVDATITGTVVMWEDAADTLVAASAAKPLPIDVISSVLPTGASTSANQSTIITSVQLLDDTVYIDDADWTDDTSKHLLVGGLYQATPQTVTDGDVAPFQIDSTGRLLVGGGVAATQSGIWSVRTQDGSGTAITSSTEGSLQPLHVALVDPAGNALATLGTDATYDAAALTAGPQVMGVFDDTATDSVDEGDAGSLRISANRNLYTSIRDAAGNERGANVTASNELLVNCSNCSGSGAVHTDDAAFTPATDDGAVSFAVFDDTTPDSVDEGDGGAVRMSANRNLYVTIRDAAGNERGLNIDANNALAVAATNLDVQSGGADLLTETTGAAILTSANFAAAFGTAGSADTQVMSVQGIASMTPILSNPGTATLWGVYVEDVAETAAGNLMMAGTVRRDTTASSAGASGDNATLNTDGLGRTWVRDGGPCQDHARISDVVINTATSGNVELVALNGSDVFYVCGYNFIADAAVDVQFISGTGTACATGETDETGPYGAGANGGIAVPNAGYPQFTTAAGAALCIELGGAVQVSGLVSYVRTAAP